MTVGLPPAVVGAATTHPSSGAHSMSSVGGSCQSIGCAARRVVSAGRLSPGFAAAKAKHIDGIEIYRDRKQEIGEDARHQCFLRGPMLVLKACSLAIALQASLNVGEVENIFLASDTWYLYVYRARRLKYRAIFSTPPPPERCRWGNILH